MSDRDDELTETERRALRALAEGPEPSAALEAATRERLRRAGELAGPRRSGRVWLSAAAAAAGLALFVAGVVVGERRAGPGGEAGGRPRFALFLYDAPDEESLDPAQMERRVEEYRAWARDLRAKGVAISGEKLEPEARRLPPESGTAAWPLGGYFVISTRDLDAALEVARSCPHLRHGGRIEVRAIAHT